MTRAEVEEQLKRTGFTRQGKRWLLTRSWGIEEAIIRNRHGSYSFETRTAQEEAPREASE